MTGEATLPWGAPWGRPSADIAVSEQIARDQIERDASLVEKCLHGDNGAWEELVRAHTRIVYGTCHRFTGNPDDARELTQEVFLRVFRALDRYDGRCGSFRTWLMRLTRNLLIDHYRKNRKHTVLEAIEDQHVSPKDRTLIGGRADHALARRETGELLRAALARLSMELREAVILRDLQEMEYKEIADVLDIPQGTVKSRINRGRRELARQLRSMGVRP
jgi:RNA polymerase sigma-70 factor (ECF subfamily)